MRDKLLKFLNGPVSPMVYIMTFVSIVIGFAHTFLIGLPEIQNSLLYKLGMWDFLELNSWGTILFIAAVTMLVGLLFKVESLIKLGSFVGFLMWLAASISYAMGGYFYVIIIYSGFHGIFFAYVALASSLRFLWRRSIEG